MAFTQPLVPTGMKRGVVKVPWAVVTTPALALQRESLCSNFKIIFLLYKKRPGFTALGKGVFSHRFPTAFPKDIQKFIDRNGEPFPKLLKK
jgi:hypothetical protein